MKEPTVIYRARALVNHARVLGASPEEFDFPVTPEKGFDILGWWRQQAPEGSMNFELYDQDVMKAARRGNPFPVLEHFKLFGMTIIPKGATH